MAVAADSRLVAERLADRLPEADARVLDRVVLVDLEVAGGLHGQVDRPVPGEQLEHVVEEADAAGHLAAARAVEIHRQLDVRFGGLALDLGFSHGTSPGGVANVECQMSKLMTNQECRMSKFFRHLIFDIRHSFDIRHFPEAINSRRSRRVRSICSSVPTLIRSPSPQPG